MSDDDRRHQRLERFRETARERVWKINLVWIQLEQGQTDDSAIAELRRELHTLKGETSLMGFLGAAEMAHAIEDALSVVGRSGDIDPEVGDHILTNLDLVVDLVGSDPSPEVTAVVRERVGRLRLLIAERQQTQTESQAIVSKDAEPAPQSVPSFSVKLTRDQLDRVRDIIGDLMLTRTRLSSTATSLRDNRAALHTGTEMGDVLSDIEHSLRDDVVRMGTLVEALEDITRELRMVPIGVLFERFPRAARDMARELGKQVQVVTEGQAVELDREVLEALSEPLLHIVRNAIDHGLELPAERRRSGKPAIGTLELRAQVAGRFLDVEVRDDGRGIDTETVRRYAVDRGLVEEESARVLTHDQLLSVLVSPGMTTRSAVTQMSGRGVGLDVVHKTLQSLGGSLTLHSENDRGTSFKLSVPISMAITSVVIFEVGHSIYAVPAGDVLGLTEEGEHPVTDSLSGPALYYEDQLVPLVELTALLDEPEVDDERARAPRLLLVRSASGPLALAGGRNFSQRDVVLKTAGNLLNPRRLVIAGTALEDGSVALVLGPSSIARHRSEWPTASMLTKLPAPGDAVLVPTTTRTVLVVDDSPVVLDLIAETLRGYGLTVIEAADGREALDILEDNDGIDMLVTDIEMPRMDGLSLISELRDRGGRRIPAIVVSTRGSDADKMAAMQVGADAYLVKSDFSKDSLWTLVSQFVN